VPLFNRDRRRVSDLVAGTIVVRAPRAKLLADLVDEKRAADAPAPVATFIPSGPGALVIDAIAFALAAGLAIRRFDLLSVMQSDPHGRQVLAR